jgi:large subunit ribosomal protein L3
MKGILGQKLGMTAIFNEDGIQVPVTAIKVAGNVVVAKRTTEKDGYSALVLGFGEKRIKRLNSPMKGFFRKQGLLNRKSTTAKRYLREIRVAEADLASFTIGQELKANEFFLASEKVDVIGTIKGRGFTGVMKRHNFSGTKASHGVHEYFRHGGSIGSSTYPAHVFKNVKMPGHYGNSRVTIQNLKVVKILEEEGIVLVRGGIPGANGGLVIVQQAVKVRR